MGLVQLEEGTIGRGDEEEKGGEMGRRDGREK